MAVGGGQVISLFSDHDRGSLFNINGILHFALKIVLFLGQKSGFTQEHLVSCARQSK